MTAAIWWCVTAAFAGYAAAIIIDSVQERRQLREDARIIEAELRRLIPEAYEEKP